jgi:hypothetical protein
MPDLTSKLMPVLNDYLLPGLDIGDGVIHPAYHGQSILNIPNTICQWMGLPRFGEEALSPEISSLFGKNIRRVLLILVDGLAFHRFHNWQKTATVWETLIKDGIVAPLTSVVPSTTSTGLTSLWTGRSPASHGILGYEMWLKEFSMVANMILHTPMTFRGSTGSLEKAGFSPLTFLNTPTLGSHLRNHGVKSHSFTHYSIANSGLSQMLMQDVEVHPFQTPASLWVSIRRLIETDLDEQMFIWTYWGQLDGISHYHGPDDERAEAEFLHFSTAFEDYFLKKLKNQARKNTLVILTADHGQTYTPLRTAQEIKNHPGLYQHLRIKPTCENRFAFLYLREGREEQVRQYFSTHFPNHFSLITQDEAIQSGLFGPGSHHPDLLDRIGDLIAIAHDDAYLWWANEEDFLLGRHGSLYPEDMLVPFLAARL